MEIKTSNGVMSSTNRTFGYASAMARIAITKNPLIDKRILILGSGLGRIIWAVQGMLINIGEMKGVEIHAVDYDPIMIKNMVKPIKSREIQHNVVIKQADAIKYVARLKKQFDITLYDLFYDSHAVLDEKMLDKLRTISTATYINLVMPDDKAWLLSRYKKSASLVWRYGNGGTDWSNDRERTGNSIYKLTADHPSTWQHYIKLFGLLNEQGETQDK